MKSCAKVQDFLCFILKRIERILQKNTLKVYTILRTGEIFYMKKAEQKNASLLVSSSAISKIGDVLFDYVNNSFLASFNMNSMVLVGVYQSLENIMGVLFNLFGGVIADRFRRKKIIILSDFLSGLACIALSFISDNTWLIYAIIAANVFLAFLSSFFNTCL